MPSGCAADYDAVARTAASVLGRPERLRVHNAFREAQYEVAEANVQALEKGIGAAKSNAAAVEANLARLNEFSGGVEANYEHGLLTIVLPRAQRVRIHATPAAVAVGAPDDETTSGNPGDLGKDTE